MTAPTRAPRKRAAATPKKTATPPETASTTEDVTSDQTAGKSRVQFAMEALDSTKSYAKFSPPKSSGCVGTLYVPLGVEEVKVLLIGPAE